MKDEGQIAGVEPRFETYDGDPAAYVISANVNRRHLTAGQRAMAVAMIKPDGGKGGRGKRSVNPEEVAGFSSRRLAHARMVLRFNPEMAKAVLAGSRGYDVYEGDD